MKEQWTCMCCLSLYGTCMEPVWNLYGTCMWNLYGNLYWNLYLKPVWNLYVLSCLVLSCLTPDFCLPLILPWFCVPYKRGVLYAQTVLAQILSFAIIPLTSPQATPNVTLIPIEHSDKFPNTISQRRAVRLIYTYYIKPLWSNVSLLR